MYRYHKQYHLVNKSAFKTSGDYIMGNTNGGVNSNSYNIPKGIYYNMNRIVYYGIIIHL